MKRYQRFKKLLLAGDIACMYGGLALTLAIRYGQGKFLEQFALHLLPFSIIYITWIVILYILNFYGTGEMQGFVGRTIRIARAIGIGGLVAVLLFYLFPYFLITPRANLFSTLAITFILLTLWRTATDARIRTSTKLRVLILGSSPEIDDIITFIKTRPHFGYEIVQHIKNIDSAFPEMIRSENIAVVVAAENYQSNKEFVALLYDILPLGVSYMDVATFYERMLGKIPLSLISEVWFLENLAETEKRFFESGKRAIDIAGSLLLGILLLVLFPILALIVKTGSKGPIFYKQTRLGRGKKQFTLLKFRTMYNDAEASGPQWATKDDPRVTAIGRFLRKTRLDELPQAWNVLKGDLSFVGPRPERPEFIENLRKTIPFYDMRLLVRPGLSGWAQINPPYYYGTEQEAYIKLQYDLFYIKNRDFGLDLSIALKTLAVLFSRLGR